MALQFDTDVTLLPQWRLHEVPVQECVVLICCLQFMNMAQW